MTLEDLRATRRDEIMRRAAEGRARQRARVRLRGKAPVQTGTVADDQVDVVSSRGLRDRVRETVLRDALPL
jgi:hypothetical protein